MGASAVTVASEMRYRDAATAAALAALFGAVALAVEMGTTRRIDRALRRAHPHPRAGAPRIVARGVRIGGEPAAMGVASIGVAALLGIARVPGARAVIIASWGAFAVDRLAKHSLPRHRPPGYRHVRQREMSFPSGHTASAAALFLTTAMLLQRANPMQAPYTMWAALGGTLIVGDTRLLLDEHWPSDVLAGGLLGGAVAMVALAVVD